MFSWIPRLTGKRVILTIHGLDWARDKWKGSFGSWYIRMGERSARGTPMRSSCSTTAPRNTFWTPMAAPPTISPTASTRGPCPRRHHPGKVRPRKDSYILYLGRMVPEKGCHYLVDAFKKLDTDKKLVIAGGSSDTQWYMDKLKEQAGGDERVIFTGFVDGALREELYSNACLFVLPSDLEGMPLCLLEAMSYGNCVITSDIEECTNVIHDNGISFRKSDVDDLAQKLTYALSHPNTVRMFKWLAAEYVCTRFPWSASWRKRSRSTRKNNGIQKSACCIRSRRFSLQREFFCIRRSRPPRSQTSKSCQVCARKDATQRGSSVLML